VTREYTPSPVQVRALEALATYKLLNAKQMQRLGVARDIREVRHALRDLVAVGWIGQSQATLISGVKRLPSLYWVSAKGAETLAPIGIETLGSRRRMKQAFEIEHRMAIVEAHMALRAWSGASVDWFLGDFEPGSPGFHKATTVRGFTPDAIARIHPPDGIPRLLVFEIEWGGEDERLTGFWRKLGKLHKACQDELVEDEFGVERAARFLILFQSEAMQARALSKWQLLPAVPEWENFYTKALDSLTGDFGAGWLQPGRPGLASLF
jgi:hypothetical protein